MSEWWALTGRHVRDILRGRAFRWTALAFGVLLVLTVVWAPPGSSDFVPAVWAAAMVVVAMTACVAASAVDALPADRDHGRTAWLRTLAPPGWKDRLGATTAAVLAVLSVGLVAAVGLGFWAALALDEDFALHSHEAVPVAPRARVMAPRVDGEPGPSWAIALPPSDLADSGRRVAIRIGPQGDVRRSRADIIYAAGEKIGEREVATRGTFVVDVPADAKVLSIQTKTSRVNLRVRGVDVLGRGQAPGVPLAVRLLWMTLLVAAVVPLGIACSRFTTSATAGALIFCVLLAGSVRRPLLELVHVLRTDNESSRAVSLLDAMGHAIPDLPFLPLAVNTADGQLVPIAQAAPWGALSLFALAGVLLVCLPVRREWNA